MKRSNRTAYHYRQEAAADIALRLIMADSKKFYPLIAEIIKDYGLQTCPFTHLPCTTHHYVEACREYDRQTMEAMGYDV